MDYFKFPKDRGSFDGAGRAQAHFLDDIDVPFLHTRLADGAVASKMNDWLYVTTAPTGTGGYFSSALVGDEWVLVGSRTARGTFMLLNPLAVAEDTRTNTAVENLGRGFAGFTFLEKTTGTWNSPFVGEVVQFKVALHATSNGRSYTAPLVEPPILATENAFATAPLQVLGAGVVGGPGSYREQSEYAMVSLDDAGHTFPQYAARWREGSVAVRVGNLDWREPMRPLAARVGPNSRIMLRRYTYGATDHETGLPDTAVPAEFSFSSDGGATWAPLAMPAFDADFAAVVAAAQAVFSSVTDVNFALAPVLSSLAIQVAPLSATRALIAFTVPLFHADNQPPGTFNVDDCLRMGLIDIATGEISGVVTAYDSRTDSGYPNNGFGAGHGYAQRFLFQLLPVDGGVLAVTLPSPLTANGQPNYGGQRLVQFTADGVSFTPGFRMPGSACFTGRITGVDPKTLVCPMQDGDFSLYETKDHGATWAKRATIYSGAAVPVPIADNWEMQSFNSVVAVRAPSGDPAPFTASAPWTTDARIKAPSA